MTLSTHVLDTAAGRPGAGVRVELAVVDPHDPDAPAVPRGSATTDDDGRAVLLAGDVPAGTYRLRFVTGGAFHPHVDVTVTTPLTERLHVPLLVSPFGYTTYRGS